jgi:hypothetical protein
MSLGPAVSIWPPDPQKPRVVYDNTVYPALASLSACTRYSRSLRPQLLMNTIAGWRPGEVGSTRFASRRTPSAAVMLTERNPVVGLAAAAAALVVTAAAMASARRGTTTRPRSFMGTSPA